jgi:hypothetical protein
MPAFTVGQTVVAVESTHWCITKGKRYVVTHVTPEHVAENGFRYHASVTVVNDHGDLYGFHTYRFRTIDASIDD